MKKFALLPICFVTILLALTVVQGQPLRQTVKWDEGAVQPGCGEYGRIAWFMEEMMVRQKDARGLIIVFKGDEPERYGNLLGYVSGAGGWVAQHGVPASKISYVIAEGKAFAEEEYWIIPNGSEPPSFTPAQFDWNALREPYLFSSTCTTCEPSYPELGLAQPNYEGFAQVLRDNPTYRGRLEVNNYNELAEIREELTGNLRIPRTRYSIKIKKKVKGAEADTSELYIIPGTN